MNEKKFQNFSRLVLVTVFLVILAGGIVRTTQSGMGCPDWPRCFGKWIPPTNESQLPPNYKQIYAFKYVDTSFNVYHTWVEYFNRLLGVLLGFLIIIQFIWIMIYWKHKKNVALLCGATLLLTGFQGYLGSKVVEANLEVVKITIHMLTALIIAGLSITIINKMDKRNENFVNNNLKSITLVTGILLIVQIIMGTQVRQQIDDISKSMDFTNRDQWVSHLNSIYYIHRSFSLIVAGLCIYLFKQYNKGGEQFRLASKLMLLSVFGNIILGVIMAYWSIPSFAQPAHLVFSSVLLVTIYYLWLNTNYQKFTGSTIVPINN